MDNTTVLTLTRDAKPVTRGTIIELMRYIHQTHCYSFEHALRFEGYAVQDETGHRVAFALPRLIREAGGDVHFLPPSGGAK